MGFSFGQPLAVLYCRKSWLFSGFHMPFSRLTGHSDISQLISAMHTAATAAAVKNFLTSCIDQVCAIINVLQSRGCFLVQQPPPTGVPSQMISSQLCHGVMESLLGNPWVISTV